MFKLTKELFQLLTPEQRKRLYRLQFLVILMAFSEVIGVASITPFMALVGDISVLEEGGWLAEVYRMSGFQDPFDFVFLVGVTVLIMLTLAGLISMYTIWQLAMFGARVGTEIADRLYTHYMKQSWLFHACRSSAQLTKQVSTEAIRVTDNVIQPLIQMNAKIVLAFFLSVAIFLYNPMVAVVGLSIFTFAYSVLYRLVRQRLHKNGQVLSEASTERFRLMNEGFGGIKDILLLNHNQYFIDQFEKSGKEFAYARGNNVALWQVPRYFMELVTFGTMIGLVLYLIKVYQGDLGVVLPILAVYALAGFKLLPAFQQIYSSISQIRGNIAAFEAIRSELLASQESEKREPDPKDKQAQEGQAELEHRIQPIVPKEEIKLENVTFRYPGSNNLVLDNLNMVIKANSLVGIVGASGSGKSTVIDIILGLISPESGSLKVDGVEINEENKKLWQQSIGFVSQSIFLGEGTIAENVAFGVPKSQINLEQVNRVLKLAHLEELVDTLEEGVHTKVGERGVKLSGGQRQRIGIARALYHNADVVVFDEATSALDGITEKMIMEAIHDFSGTKTIVMIAHRLKTVARCHQIFVIDKGQVADQGTYEQLLKHNAHFKKMAEHA